MNFEVVITCAVTGAGDFLLIYMAATVFFAEVEGHPSDVGLGRALAELDYFSREVRIMGVYPAHPFRREEAANRH